MEMSRIRFWPRSLPEQSWKLAAVLEMHALVMAVLEMHALVMAVLEMHALVMWKLLVASSMPLGKWRSCCVRS